MTVLILTVIVLLGISFLCSILESVILSISRPYIQILISKKNPSGKLLSKYKEEIDEPITAILTLNTISHTIGATVSGAMALKLFGSEWMALFSGILTFLILIFSEIIPKTIGAHYWKSLGPVSAHILKFMIIALKPVVVPMNYLSKLISGGNPSAKISKTEMLNFLKIGKHQGVLSTDEFKIVRNVFKLENIDTEDIMTPRTMVFWLPFSSDVKSLVKKKTELQYSRIPLYNQKTNTVEGIVLRRDIMDQIRDKKTSVKLMDISSKPLFMPASVSAFKLLDKLIKSKTHITAVVNEHGDYIGIATLEDVIEALIGREIVDEFDKENF